MHDVTHDISERNNQYTELSAGNGTDDINSFISITMKDIFHEMKSIIDYEDKMSTKPMWDYVSETPMLIDTIHTDFETIEDEFVYWPN